MRAVIIKGILICNIVLLLYRLISSCTNYTYHGTIRDHEVYHPISWISLLFIELSLVVGLTLPIKIISRMYIERVRIQNYAFISLILYYLIHGLSSVCIVL